VVLAWQFAVMFAANLRQIPEEFAANLDEEGSISVGNLEAVFCRIDVISEFAASAEDCEEQM